MQDRRQDRDRERRRLTVQFRPLGTDKDLRGGFSDDISPRGLFIQTAFSVPPGRRVELFVELPGGVRRLVGTVAWARRAPAGLTGKKRSGMGIRLDPGQEGLDVLDQGADTSRPRV